MSVDHNAYIGPYLRVIDTIKEKTVDTCIYHNFPVDALYCPACGQRRELRMKVCHSGNAPPYWEDNYVKDGKKVDFHDCMFSCLTKKGKENTSISIYLPNTYFDEIGIPMIDGGKYAEEEVSFDDLNAQDMTQKFVEKFKDEIAYLRQWFVVEVKFGYVAYCS